MTSYEIIIGNKNYSSWSLRAWLPLAQAQAAGLCRYKETVIRLNEPNTHSEIIRDSPTGKVPCLMKSGKMIAWDSLAIGEYLAESYAQLALWPSDRAARAMARSVVAEMHSGFSPLRSACPMNIKLSMPEFKPSPEVMNDILRIEAIFTDCLKTAPKGGFLFGASGLADWFYAPVVMRFLSYHLAQTQLVRDYCQTVAAHPLVADWITAAQAEP